MIMKKTDYQIAAVNALKAVDAEKQSQELTDEQRWDLWYEAELKALAEAMFDMDEKDFYNEDYTPINNMAMFDIQAEDFDNNEYTPLNNVIR